MIFFDKSKLLFLISVILLFITSCEREEDAFVDSISILSTTNLVKVDEELQLKYVLNSSYPEQYRIDWFSSLSYVASINSEGVVKGLNEGKSDIILTAQSASHILKDTLSVVVSTVEVETVDILQDSIKIEEGKTFPLKFAITPSNATNQHLEWYSSEPSIAKVKNGNVEALSPGICVVFAKSSNNKTDSAIVEVVSSKLLEITVDNAGSLRDVIGGKDSFDSIKRLKINGTMNAYDIEDIRNMNYLTYLDISNVKLVPGGVYGGNYHIVEYKLDDWMFSGLKLRKIILPQNTREIGFHVFDGCKKLEECILPDSLISIGYASFMDCSSLKCISLPKSLKKIGYHSFSSCESLKEVVIPNNVYFIDADAFYACKNLEKIVFGSGIKTMGRFVFYKCKNIIVIYMNTIPDTETTISTDIFDETIYNKATLYIPKGTRESYKHTPFENFKKILEF